MFRKFFAVLALMVAVAQLGGCVVYDDGGHRHWHYWYR